MEMYKSVPEALKIFHAIDKNAVFSIVEEISGTVLHGTKDALFVEINSQSEKYNGQVSHAPADVSNVEVWAIIEAAYNV